MPLSDIEIDRLLTLQNNACRVYLAVRRLSPLFVPPSKIVRLARVSPRRVQLVLAAFVERGWFEREVRGFGPSREVRYVLTERSPGIALKTIAGDRLENDPPRSVRSPTIGDPPRSVRSPAIAQQTIPGDRALYGRARASDPDLPVEVVPTRSVRPSGGGSGEGTDGRTDAEKFAKANAELVGSITEAWDLQRTVVALALGRFVAELATLSTPVPEHELREYLRAALLHREQRKTHPAFQGIPIERFFGIACTLERFERWRRSKPPLAPARVELTCNSCGHVQRGLVKPTTTHVGCRECGERIPIAATTNDAIAELVKRAGGAET